ncbi:LOW QUALITY PROTEIN: Hypothetical protein PHPALM_6279 [Phytophthora palmivora]|uniref:Reverse transcriptase n=1 Tax=Phytophthora palmivora TaxID=4796 RepID=A0A2P4YF84_9STRA|nr:LOW QUALITY PROTEIN: Hypothetical protein PHPALM_6279 [Phytophthora palmivora]
MGMIACKKETLQVELARHKELTKKLNSVQYLHVIRLYNSAADSMATEALETQISRVVLNAERKAELKTLNRIPEILYATGDSTDECEEGLKACPITRSQVRRVRFEDDERKKTTSPEFGDTQPGSQGDEVELNASRAPSADEIDPAVVQAERQRRIDRAQDEELRWADLKAYLRGELSQLSFRRVRNAGKVAGEFVLSEDGLLYRHNRSRQRGGDDEPSLSLRLVVPTTMVDEVLQNCHNSVEGGHQGLCGPTTESKLTTIGLDCMQMWFGTPSHAKIVAPPRASLISKGTLLATSPTIPYRVDGLCHTAPANSAGQHSAITPPGSLYWVRDSKDDGRDRGGALEVAKVFEENVFRRFGAPFLVRHDRDPRFMSEVFQKFSEMMQSRSRATLSYWPQANGQQEQSVKTMIQTVRVYVEDPLQADWDDIAEKMVYAINNSRDSTRQETPLYLVHGWDARSTMKAMTESVRKGQNSSADVAAPAEWRREANRQREVALRLAAEYQLKEKARRAKEHNESLIRVERRATPQTRGNSETAGLREVSAKSAEASAESMGTPAGSTKPLFKEGDQQGLTKKLAHRWHGPFRVKRKVEEFAYELVLPDKSGYRFYPVIHVSRLKKVADVEKRPTTRLIAELEEDQRFDFDEELLPEDSWEPDEGASQYEVEAILDIELPLFTSTARNERRFKVKWVGYEEPSWEPLSNLSCGGLLFDYWRQKKRENRLQMVQVADEE